MPLNPQSFTTTHDLPQPRQPVGHVKLHFAGRPDDNDDHPIHDLSAAAMASGALFVAGDETSAVERLTPGRHGWLTDHETYQLKDFLDLNDPDEEVDIEGLEATDGWLWITGSHSRTRHDPREDGAEPDCIDINKLAELKDTRARCVLARIPLEPDGNGYVRPVGKSKKRRAGLVAQKKKYGSKLARQLCEDVLIGPSTAMAAKEGGLDIEGIAAVGDRVVLGLRGPVLSSFAILVEPRIEPKKKGKLHLEGAPFRRMVDLNGLGVRDLMVDGADLYILAGPTQDLDGRCAIYRWVGWAADPPRNENTVRVHRPEHLFDLPVKWNHDHPEAVEFWQGEGGERRLLVLYDSPNPERVDLEQRTILGDLFALD